VQRFILHTRSCPGMWLLPLSVSLCALYSAVHGVGPVLELGKLAGGSTGCGELTRGVCSFAGYFSATRLERGARPNMTLSLH
jgi:hypothetical protein